MNRITAKKTSNINNYVILFKFNQKYKMIFEEIKYTLTITLKNIKIYNRICFAEINVRI